MGDIKRLWIKPDSDKGGLKIIQKKSEILSKKKEKKDRLRSYRKVRSWEALEECTTNFIGEEDGKNI